MSINIESNLTPITEEFKEQSSKFNISKIEIDLFHDEDNVVEKVVRVKRISLPNKNEKWKVLIDNKVTFVIEGTKISKPEKEFLCTIDGFNFILNRAKVGIKSLNNFRAELRKHLNIQTKHRKK